MEGSEYPFDSLQEIRLRKAKLKGEINTQEKSMQKLWDSVFHQKQKKGVMTPSKRMSQIVTTGMGVFDGAMLAFKLYRKFKK